MDVDALIKKIDYLVKIQPAAICSTLDKSDKTKVSYETIPKEQIRADLIKLGAEEIERLYNEEIVKQREQRENDEKKLFFHQPYYNADFSYFGKKALWSIEEGITLILGKDPGKIKWDNIKMYSHLSPLVKKFEEIKELALNYNSAGQLPDPITPGKFLAWAERMQFDIPLKLKEAVQEIGAQIADWQTLYTQSIELLDKKDQIIQLQRVMNDKLHLSHEELKNNPLQMDHGCENYAPELDAANNVYRAVINNRNESLSFKQQALLLIEELYPKCFSKESKERIATVINTKKGKKGGRAEILN
ncbi:hypothetical protein DGG96_08990 [Legionella qingyii]|uniref:Uncharacterized protein n=1 Tax=Legionella qingyii TaxID=2184757 RepID=A0A317U2S0_9GAMM|nr:hypothetical protein [Legionella qingyii]PWY56061.1 hypothetical protein DGG96_08990 [Legionella qingyii]RUR22064.1 hypothetical protein ELY20_10910 [Legionella qingyii]RUR25644.1 hypothetical protein ELY16_09720 [Legionella qingyii]